MSCHGICESASCEGAWLALAGEWHSAVRYVNLRTLLCEARECGQDGGYTEANHFHNGRLAFRLITRPDLSRI